MIIDCISDLHGYFPELEGGDLLIIAGDLTMNDSLNEINRFKDWLVKVGSKYKKTVMVAGNHDNWIEMREFFSADKSSWQHAYHCYLEDSGTEFEGLKIYGSPWTKRFHGMNHRCMAFTCDTEHQLHEKFSLIPDDIDILITHSPPYGFLDKITREGNVGSTSLREHVLDRIQPSYHIFGHIHENGGQQYDYIHTNFINASHVDECYDPIHKPIRIIIDKEPNNA